MYNGSKIYMNIFEYFFIFYEKLKFFVFNEIFCTEYNRLYMKQFFFKLFLK